jgi:hypothetical protein
MSIGSWFRSLGSSIASLFVSTEEKFVGVIDVFFKVEDDLKAAVQTFKDLEKFDFDPKWRTRVINVPRAIEAIQQTFDIIRFGLRDKFDELRSTVETLINTLKGDQGRSVSDEGPSAVANVASKVASISIALTQFQEAFHTAVQFEQMIDDIKQKIESLDDLFLPQDKPRKYITKKRRARVKT